MDQTFELTLILWLLVVIICITIPSLIMRWFGKKILRKNVSEKEKIYEVIKIEILCIFWSGVYLIITIFLGMLDRLSKIVDSLLLPEIIRAFLFVFLLVLPMLISIFLVIYEAVKVGTKITKEKIEKKDILEELAWILGPIFAFAFIWLTLILYLPESLTSKWWFNFALFSLLILLFFAIFPILFVKIGSMHELDPKLREELLKFCSECGVKIKDIVVKGKSEHKGANAMITGIIPNYRYIILTHAIVKNFDKEEIKAIIAHELGHVKEKHLWINASISICWFLFWSGIIYSLLKLEIDISSSPYIFFGIYFFAIFFWIFGIESWITRRNEFKADEFAAKVCGKEVTIKALKKLAEINLMPEKTGKWFDMISMHPSIKERIRRLQEL